MGDTTHSDDRFKELLDRVIKLTEDVVVTQVRTSELMIANELKVDNLYKLIYGYEEAMGIMERLRNIHAKLEEVERNSQGEKLTKIYESYQKVEAQQKVLLYVAYTILALLATTIVKLLFGFSFSWELLERML